ncbi:hypothetical protein HYH03_002771 [Edaphochlamys debaryana]|uniref:CCDC81 HU domain-containing protein n=1 Tax=Edaphochlamys debaryana TaxID=47281 RepID=A0A835YIE6_9CHLO|nr:hypothetical protein HYH03_002771 [Edaphochlamys debaryana]|eukprot:KAG2499190.1 hypothetical protein HYH03_002771 [Edaphochlamys debaryana]
MEVLSEHMLIAEVANGTFTFKNKIATGSIKLLWDKMSRFIADALKQQKGVLIPNLGTFIVGPVVGEVKKKVRPVFALLETRYAGVSQERPKYSIGGRCAVIQPNYTLLSSASGVHRGACQRLVVELMQRLGVAILSGRPVAVAFPGVGRLHTNKAGRISFEFEPLLREYFELERERVISEMPYDRGDVPPSPALEEDPVPRQLVKGLQQVHLHNPPVVQSRPVTGASGRPESPSQRARRNQHAPYKGALLDLYRMCKQNDRIGSGCVPRLQLEQWLHSEVRSALRHLAAATVLELLATHTFGKTGKHILYKPFLDQLEACIGDVEPREPPPQLVQSPKRLVEVRIESPRAAAAQAQRLQWQAAQEDELGQRWQLPSDGEEEPEITFSPQGQYPPPPLALPQTPGMAFTPGGVQQAWPPPQTGQSSQPPQSAYPPQQQQQQQQRQQQGSNPPWASYSPQQQQPQAQQQQQQQYGFSPMGYQQQSPYGQSPYGPGPGLPAPGPTEDPLVEELAGAPTHYYQNALSPRSRLAYDNFNRVHFGQIEQARGRDYKHRVVTPKVGEEQLNRREFQAMRHASEAGSPSPAEVARELGQQDGPPYSQHTPQPVVGPPRRRGSPGPQPQIMNLSHEAPSAYPSPRAVAVPGLPSHFYQPQPPTPQPWTMTPGQRQSTPSQQQLQQQQQRMRTPGQQQPQPSPQPRQSRPGSTAAPSASPVPPISQYDIINEPDPVLRQRKRNELAYALQKNYSEQIREKESVLQNIAAAESQWPYAPTGQGHDKRPPSAVSQQRAGSRPSSARRPSRPG